MNWNLLNKVLVYQKILYNIIKVLVHYVNGACLFQVSTIVDKDKNLEGDEFVVIDMTSPETTKKTLT